MLRSSALILLLASGCAAEEAKKTWGAHTCEQPEGHIKTLTWCPGEWRTWHDEGQAASAGDLGPDGELMPAHTLWWRDGTVASKLDGDKLVAMDEAGQELGSLAWKDSGPDACPIGAPKRQVLDSGHKKLWCESAEGEPHGRMTTVRVDGSVESIQFWVKGVRHGPFEAYHADGSVWIRGTYAAGKRHGPWLTWDASGQVHQDSLQPEWVDHKARDSWARRTRVPEASGG